MEANREYDLAFSVGQACACSLTLRTAHLQFASFPFDWMAGATLASRIDLLVRRFDHWLEKEDFVYKGKNPVNGLGSFFNQRTGLTHLHDFIDGPIEQSHAQVVAKYARREKRLLDLIEKSRRVLMVHIDSAKAGTERKPNLDEIVAARADMSKAFPGVTFDFVHFALDKDRPFDRRVVTCPAEGLTEIRFDYHSDISDVDYRLAARALLSLGVAVRDYRTDEERKAHKLKRQMEKYGAKTRLGLLWAKLMAKGVKIFRPFCRATANPGK